MLRAEQGAYVQDITSVYQYGGGGGLLTVFVARCDVCPWSGLAQHGGGGGSPTPWFTDTTARAAAQHSADAHNAKHHAASAE